MLQHNDKYSLKRGDKIFSYSIIAEIITTVSWHVLYFPLATTIFCQLPEFQLFYKGYKQSYTVSLGIVYQSLCLKVRTDLIKLESQPTLKGFKTNITY